MQNHRNSIRIIRLFITLDYISMTQQNSLFIKLLLTISLLSVSLLSYSQSDKSENINIKARLAEAATGSHRSDKNIARNQYRHPVETLDFFGIESGMTVLEISPGGLWYTEVLAPALRDNGKLIVAGYDVNIPDQPKYRYRQQTAMLKRFKEQSKVFGQVEIVKFSAPQSVALGDDSSVDMVVTFRNFHGWIDDGIAADNMQAFYRVLKPGGILGVVQHRTPVPNPRPEGRISGYVTESQILDLALDAGFVLEARSEVNANVNDSRNHPGGVWTLPPVLTLKDKDREKYLAIGESDRMTLKFRKL